jgi:hypothetical protein
MKNKESIKKEHNDLLKILIKPKFFIVKNYISSLLSMFLIIFPIILFMTIFINKDIEDINSIYLMLFYIGIFLCLIFSFLGQSFNIIDKVFNINIYKTNIDNLKKLRTEYNTITNNDEKLNNKIYDNNINSKLKFSINPTNKNTLIISKKVNNKEILSYIAIPKGMNRTDIITDKALINGYNYNVDSIIIISDNNNRKIYYNNQIQLVF